MKTQEIGEKFCLDYLEFNKFLENYNLEYKPTMLGEVVVDDSLVDTYVALFLDVKADNVRKAKEFLEQQAVENALIAEENARKKKAMAEMLITSGFNFEGYRIVKYSGYISGDDAIQVPRGMAVFGVGTTNTADDLMKSLVRIRRNALRELKEAAYDLGCNAVIGVDFDYLTLDPQTANLSGGTTYQPYVFWGYSKWKCCCN